MSPPVYFKPVYQIFTSAVVPHDGINQVTSETITLTVVVGVVVVVVVVVVVGVVIVVVVVINVDVVDCCCCCCCGCCCYTYLSCNKFVSTGVVVVVHAVRLRCRPNL